MWLKTILVASEVRIQSTELSVEDQLQFKLLRWFGHIWRMPDNRVQKKVLKCRPQGRRRPQGRAPLRWCDMVNRDLTKVTDWQQLINNPIVLNGIMPFTNCLDRLTCD